LIGSHLCVEQPGPAVIGGDEKKPRLSLSRQIRNATDPREISYLTGKYNLYQALIYILNLMGGKVLEGGRSDRALDIGVVLERRMSLPYQTETFSSSVVLKSVNVIQTFAHSSFSLIISDKWFGTSAKAALW